MLTNRKTLAATVALGAMGLALPAASALISTAAEAMPGLNAAVMHEVAVTPDGVGGQIEQARWVCGPYRCHWAPNYYGYGYGYGPRWGYRRGWGYRHWRRW